jgi:threonine/homoserine efflux transporter RhtA
VCSMVRSTYHLDHGMIQPLVLDGHKGPLGTVPIRLDRSPLLLVMIIRPIPHYRLAKSMRPNGLAYGLISAMIGF